MTISNTLRTAGPFIGNNTATVFGFAFKVFAADQLEVVKLNTSTGAQTTLALTTDYTVALNGDQDGNPGGSVTLPAVLATGYNLTLTSNVANLQPTNLTNQGGFYPEVITDALDRATIQIQQMSDDVTRSIRSPLSDDLTSMDMTLPVVASRINKILAFDGNGMPTAVAQSPSSITGNTTIVGTLAVTGTIQGLTVGTGTGSIASNTVFGSNALQSNTTGSANTSVGYEALQLNTTGQNNSAFGYQALKANTIGQGNSAFGYKALQLNTTGSTNTAFGYNALVNNIIGTSNTALGHQALYQNLASANTAVGVNALQFNTTGTNNTAVGNVALRDNTTGTANVAIGNSALQLNTIGSGNIAIGVQTLQVNTTGSNNTAVGYLALTVNTTGASNTAVGVEALKANVTGVGNSATGERALFAATGSYNTGIGRSAGSTLTTGTNVTCVGYNAQPSAVGVTNQVVLGDTSVGTFRCQVALTVVSDERDKTNIVDIPVGLNLISKIRPVSFEWNQRDGNRIGRKEFGFTAQQLQTAQTEIGIEVPYLVADENPEHLGASPSLLIPVLVKAIQELNAKFEAYVAAHP